MRAALFNFNLPLGFATVWLLGRLFEHKPASLPLPVAPTREFCIALFTSKFKATIQSIGDMIGWESDHVTVGPMAAAAKLSLLRLIPHMMPIASDEDALYRLVLEHGDFGIHNISIMMDEKGQPVVTSLYDWETGCNVPAIVSDPLMAVIVDLVADAEADALPAITRVDADATSDERAAYTTWTRGYFNVCIVPSFPPRFFPQCFSGEVMTLFSVLEQC